MSSQSRYVTTAHDGWRLERFLAIEFEDTSPREIRRKLLAGEVRVGGELGWLGYRLRSGQRVTVDFGSGPEAHAPVSEFPTVIADDPEFLVVAKTAGVTVVPDRTRSAPSIIELLRDAAPAGEERFVVHRIDRDATGIVVFAKNRASHRHLSRQFQNREVSKEYLAIVTGEPDRDEPQTIELPIGHDPREKMRMRTDRREGKPSRTTFRVVERFRDFALVGVRPETGRTHQIRVHMAGIGHPLAVDPMYGGSDVLTVADLKNTYRPKRGAVPTPLIDRLTLHAWRLHFRHPGSEEAFDVECPPPEDFELTLKMLRKYRPPKEPRTHELP